ncbi:PREDICTED: growth hormone-regulated TBC protein 1-like, partial [Acanthisitta chloris]|uniref:growth hormone-regulated TBC protein 1-like n=1 Tax=Acanthisitta chloris TaxID=57068 RepID=UPI0004F0F79C
MLSLPQRSDRANARDARSVPLGAGEKLRGGLEEYVNAKVTLMKLPTGVDPYGFERPEDFDYASYEAFFSRYLVVLTRRAIKWSKLLKGNNSIQKSLKVKRYIRKGIPAEHRALIWMIVSGAQANMEQNPGYYYRLLEGEKNDKLVEAIKT